VLIGWLLLFGLMLLPSPALAASEVQLKHASDGTLLVIGSGYRRDQELVVRLGRQHFSVRADASGEFELATGLVSYGGGLSIQHAAAQDLPFVALAAAAPNPMAVLFAWSLAEGCVLLGGVAGVWLLMLGIIRRRRSGRYPRGERR
jgi:hypothetical protein